MKGVSMDEFEDIDINEPLDNYNANGRDNRDNSTSSNEKESSGWDHVEVSETQCDLGLGTDEIVAPVIRVTHVPDHIVPIHYNLGRSLDDLRQSTPPQNSPLSRSPLCPSSPAVSDVSSLGKYSEDEEDNGQGLEDKGDVAFAEDYNMDFIQCKTVEIDLNAPALPLPRHTTAVVREPAVHSKVPGQTRSQHLSLAHQSGMIKSHSSPTLNDVGCFGFKTEDYLRNCGRMVQEARQREKLKDFRGANELLKAAVEILIAGVQDDPDPVRREGVRRRTSEYLQIADTFAARYRQQVSNKKPTVVDKSELAKYTVCSVMDKVVLVQGPGRTLKVLKSLRKPLHCNVSGHTLVVQAPFMVSLYKCCMSQDTVYLLLQRIEGLELLEYIKRFEISSSLPLTLTPTARKDDSPVLDARFYNSDPLQIESLESEEPATNDVTSPTICYPKPGSAHKPGSVPIELIRKWSAQLVVCLSNLHKQGLVYGDLHPKNIMIDDFSNICITYITQLPGLHHRASSHAIEEMYVAPEVLSGLHPVTQASDWWSLGAVIFTLLTGHPISAYFPYPALRYCQVRLPSELQSGASTLVSGLLRYMPTERLGAGALGSEEIRSHSFFSNVQWDKIEARL